MTAMSKLIVWHDGGCPLCRREIALMRRLDRRGAIEFVDVTQTTSAACPSPNRVRWLPKYVAMPIGPACLKRMTRRGKGSRHDGKR